VKLTKPTLSVPQLVYGVKQCSAGAKAGGVKLIIVFYDER
jgi:hypothetical protein